MCDSWKWKSLRLWEPSHWPPKLNSRGRSQELRTMNHRVMNLWSREDLRIVIKRRTLNPRFTVVNSLAVITFLYIRVWSFLSSFLISCPWSPLISLKYHPHELHLSLFFFPFRYHIHGIHQRSFKQSPKYQDLHVFFSWFVNRSSNWAVNTWSPAVNTLSAS